MLLYTESETCPSQNIPSDFSSVEPEQDRRETTHSQDLITGTISSHRADRQIGNDVIMLEEYKMETVGDDGGSLSS